MVSQQQFDFKQQAILFWRKKLYFIIPFVVVCILFVIGSYRLTRIYKASTTLLIGDERAFSRSEQYLFSEAGLQRLERVAKLKGLILSYDYLKDLIKQLALDQDKKIRTQALATYLNLAGLTDDEIVERWLLDNLRQNIHVESMRTEFITISVESPDPEQAYRIASAIAQIFIDKQHHNQMQGVAETLDFTSERLSYYQNKVEESEKKLQNYRMRLAQEQNAVGRDDRITKINQLLQSTKIKISELERMISNYEQNLASLYRNAVIPTSAEAQRHRSTMADVAAQTLSVIIDSDLQDIRLMRLNEKLNTARNQLRREYDNQVRQNFNSLDEHTITQLTEKKMAEIELELMKGRSVTVQRMVDSYLTSAGKVSEKEATISILQQELETNRQMYNMFLQRARNLQTEAAFQQSEGTFNSKIIEPAYLPMYPERPNKPLLMIVGAFLGAFIGAGLLLIMIFLDHSFHSIDEAELYLQIPILGTISQLPIQDERPIWKKYASAKNILISIGGVILLGWILFSNLFWKLFLGFLNKIG